MKKSYIKVDLEDIPKFGNDAQLLLWYSALKGYVRAFPADRKGYHRIAAKIIERDFGYNSMRIWRYNQKLIKKGLLKMDQKRGGATWAGYKLI